VPTHEEWAQFLREVSSLTPQERTRFFVAVRKMVADLQAGRGFRRGLRVEGHETVYEMTWAPDGRATFTYGTEVHSGEPHIIWRRIGGHEILAQPYTDERQEIRI